MFKFRGQRLVNYSPDLNYFYKPIVHYRSEARSVVHQLGPGPSRLVSFQLEQLTNVNTDGGQPLP